jgi:Protein of unknown function (DUF2953)
VILFKIIAWILIVLFLFIFISLFTKLTIDLTYKFDPNDQRLVVLIKALFGLIRIRMDIPELNDTNTEKQKSDKPVPSLDKNFTDIDSIDEDEALKAYRPIKYWMKNMNELYKVMKKSLKKVRITQLVWKSAIGTGNAATTGIISGVGWSFKGTVIGMLSYYFSLKVQPQLEIRPIFNRKISNTYVKCIFQVRAGQAILAGLKIFKLWKKMKSLRQLTENRKVHEQAGDQLV